MPAYVSVSVEEETRIEAPDPSPMPRLAASVTAPLVCSVAALDDQLVGRRGLRRRAEVVVVADRQHAAIDDRGAGVTVRDGQRERPAAQLQHRAVAADGRAEACTRRNG